MEKLKNKDTLFSIIMYGAMIVLFIAAILSAIFVKGNNLSRPVDALMAFFRGQFVVVGVAAVCYGRHRGCVIELDEARESATTDAQFERIKILKKLIKAKYIYYVVMCALFVCCIPALILGNAALLVVNILCILGSLAPLVCYFIFPSYVTIRAAGVLFNPLSEDERRNKIGVSGALCLPPSVMLFMGFFGLVLCGVGADYVIMGKGVWVAAGVAVAVLAAAFIFARECRKKVGAAIVGVLFALLFSFGAIAYTECGVIINGYENESTVEYHTVISTEDRGIPDYYYLTVDVNGNKVQGRVKSATYMYALDNGVTPVYVVHGAFGSVYIVLKA